MVENERGGGDEEKEGGVEEREGEERNRSRDEGSDGGEEKRRKGMKEIIDKRLERDILNKQCPVLHLTYSSCNLN